MDDFIRRGVADRRAYIEEATSWRAPTIIEKGFWVGIIGTAGARVPQLKRSRCAVVAVAMVQTG